MNNIKSNHVGGGTMVGGNTMKVWRAMSLKEYVLLVNGETLTNNTDWSEKCNSTSVGFCFGPGDVKDFTSKGYYNFEEAISSHGLVVFFEVQQGVLTGSKGRYNTNDSMFGTGDVCEEYCITTYNKDIMKIVGAGVYNWGDIETVYKESELKELTREYITMMERMFKHELRYTFQEDYCMITIDRILEAGFEIKVFDGGEVRYYETRPEAQGYGQVLYEKWCPVEYYKETY